MKRVYNILILMLLSQSIFSMEVDNKNALKFFDKARQSYSVGDYSNALSYISKTLSADSLFFKAFVMRGDIMVKTGNIIQAINAYKKSLQIDPKTIPDLNYDLAELLYKTGNYKEALNYYLIASETKTGLDKKISICEFALSQIKHPVAFNPINLGPNINTPDAEYYPSFTADDSLMVFTRKVLTGNPQEDIYISKKEKQWWSKAKEIGAPVNTLYNEGTAIISSDGTILIFTACSDGRDYGDGRIGLGRCDLFYSVKSSIQWSNPVNLGSPINTTAWESHPSLSADGKTLYFVRAVQGKDGKMNQDIYYTIFESDGKWKEPEKLSDIINTEGREASVFIHADGKTLYFASDGHPGMGGLDLFVSRKDENGNWGIPINLGYPINSFNDETGITVSSDGLWGYFSSDRAGGFGSTDIYRFEMPEQAKPLPVTYFKGFVYDAVKQRPLQARIDLYNIEENLISGSAQSDSRTGEFLLAMPIGNRFAFNAFAQSYLFASASIDLSSPYYKNISYRDTIFLYPISQGAKIRLDNIFFDIDSYTLRSESIFELDKIITFLKRNPNVSVEISGHTDSTGEPEYNISLSEKRAESVYNYLISHGINSSKVEYKGYGEMKPIAPNDTESSRAKNRRIEFEIKSVGE